MEIRIVEVEKNKNLGGEKKKKMKTKTKTLAVVEIAIVLCSVLLVALPVIAAASEIYKAGPLDVFGNANNDKTIDMRDTTYIKLVIFGKKPKTELADANSDGKVSMLDVGQTKLIILGKEKKLTFLDIYGEAVTVTKPIKRLVNLGYAGVQVTRLLGAEDILVGLGNQKPLTPYSERLSKLPKIKDDYEMMLSLEPDAIQPNFGEWKEAYKTPEKKREFEEKVPGIPLIVLHMRAPSVLSRNLGTYGYIIDREKEVEDFMDWFDGYLNMMKSRTKGLPEDEKPRVYMEVSGRPYRAVGSFNRYGEAINLAGGRNIIDKIDPGISFTEVDAEWVIEQNPDVIIVGCHGGERVGGYDIDDPSGMAEIRQEMLDRPELARVNAVKNNCVYAMSEEILLGAGLTIIGCTYMAKVFYPGQFEDIDSETIHQEYLDFQGLDFNVKEHGVFVYPKLM